MRSPLGPGRAPTRRHSVFFVRGCPHFGTRIGLHLPSVIKRRVQRTNDSQSQKLEGIKCTWSTGSRQPHFPARAWGTRCLTGPGAQILGSPLRCLPEVIGPESPCHLSAFFYAATGFYHCTNNIAYSGCTATFLHDKLFKPLNIIFTIHVELLAKENKCLPVTHCDP